MDLDIRMPELDEIEATRLIKAAFPDTVVIGMSAFGEAGFRTSMLDAGGVDFRDKAGAGDTLGPTISRYLAARAAVK
jgi:CheY-like chemotaxis protein